MTMTMTMNMYPNNYSLSSFFFFHLFICSFIFLLFRLDRQNEMIINATRTVAETHEVGIEITNELARNREKIVSAHNRVRNKNFLFYFLH